KVIADELGVETAAIKAVVKIEAGPSLRGCWAPGVPVVNYAQPLFNKYNAQVKGPKDKDAKVPDGLSGYALKEWTSLTRARKINVDAANMACYWGMFQIGGYNYKLCGCKSIAEMVALMSESEFSQLELFAVFIRNSGMLESLRKKDWTTFARKYNGTSYAKRGYHTRMAKEYEAFKAKEKSGAKPVAKTAAKTDTIKKSQPAAAGGKTAARRHTKK
ncbi:MAG: N-acetylmuramidase family protein, partial [Muribaculaceae bacterium]|nr:N-acetylmuramidase family protein [Muribaculaceae bacterium]